MFFIFATFFFFFLFDSLLFFFFFSFFFSIFLTMQCLLLVHCMFLLPPSLWPTHPLLPICYMFVICHLPTSLMSPTYCMIRYPLNLLLLARHPLVTYFLAYHHLLCGIAPLPTYAGSRIKNDVDTYSSSWFP